MPKLKKIIFAPSAYDDLREIRRWYATQGVPAVGKRVQKEVLAAVKRLGILPESGRIVPEFGQPGIREIIHPPFRIVYRLDEKRVRVVRIWRSERQLRLPKQS